jgi:hypothetical protein
MYRFTTKILSFALFMASFCQNIQAQTCITITEPAALTVTGSATSIACNGGTSTITAVGAGGTTPYQYNIGGGAYQNTTTFASLAAGTYTIGVKDANNCTATASVTITQPTALSVNITATENSCTANDDKVLTNGSYAMTANVTGGTSAFTYAWANVTSTAATATATVTANTTYTVTVTDANACTATATKTVTLITAPTVSITGLASAYCKDVTAITLVGTPATGTFTVDAAAATTFDPTTLTAASHSVIYSYTDANGCAGSDTKSVTVNALPAFTLASTNVTCNGAADGTITVTVTSGAQPYEYSKDNGSTYGAATATTTNTFSNLAPAAYKPTVRDTNGCVKKCQ